MRTSMKTFLKTAAVVAALAGGPAVYAYAQSPDQGPGGMMQGGQGGMGMMNMMQQMNQMMEGMNRHHERAPAKKESAPEKKG
jgi:hypothetical protein